MRSAARGDPALLQKRRARQIMRTALLQSTHLLTCKTQQPYLAVATEPQQVTVVGIKTPDQCETPCHSTGWVQMHTTRTTNTASVGCHKVVITAIITCAGQCSAALMQYSSCGCCIGALAYNISCAANASVLHTMLPLSPFKQISKTNTIMTLLV
jgi:hypothetical protein